MLLTVRTWTALLALLLVVLSGTPVSAQAITQWTARTYLAGAVAPLSPPTILLAANVLCGQPPVTGTNVNPNKAVWDDPASTAVPPLSCVWTDPGTGPLASAPFGGSYEMTLTATNSAGESPESLRAPFTHPGSRPGAPTSPRAVR